MTTIGSFCNGDGEQQKNNTFRLAKKKIFARAPRLFVHFLAVVTRPRHETSQFHAPAFWSRWAQHKNFLFLFLNLQTVLSDLTQINWLRSMKFETVRIHFLSDVLVCCHPQILLTWQRDVTTSPLYCEWFKLCPPFFKEIWKKGTRSHSPTTFLGKAVYYRKSGEATSFFLS